MPGLAIIYRRRRRQCKRWQNRRRQFRSWLGGAEEYRELTSVPGVLDLNEERDPGAPHGSSAGAVPGPLPHLRQLSPLGHVGHPQTDLGQNAERGEAAAGEEHFGGSD